MGRTAICVRPPHTLSSTITISPISAMAIFNDSSKKSLRRALRSAPTYSERALWSSLRRIGVGAKFRRQESIGAYVVDFYCPELRLAVEVDGASHVGRDEYDRQRDEDLAAFGVTTLRFSDTEVLYASDRVVATIRERVDTLRKEGRSVRKATTQKSPEVRLRESLRPRSGDGETTP